MPTPATILTVTALGLGLGAVAVFEARQARARDQARRHRGQLLPSPVGCDAWGPVYSLAGDPVGRYTGPGDGECWAECPEGYELVELDGVPRCSSTTDLPQLPTESEPSPTPEPTPEPTPGPAPEPHVGSGWTDWPQKQWFPDEAAFAETLSDLGYLDWPSTCLTQSGRFTAESCAAIVGAFQEDFNLVKSYVEHAQALYIAVGPLQLTERLDAPTITALVHATQIEQNAGKPWADVVRDAEIYFS